MTTHQLADTCNPNRWSRISLIFGFTLSVISLSITSYVGTDLIKYRPETASDYAFLLNARYNKLKMRYEESKRLKAVERRVRKAKPPKGAPEDVKKSKEKTEKPDDDRLTLVWLMAYPFAGSSVTLRIVQDYTGYSMATNYGDIVDTNRGFVEKYYESEPIDSIHPNGPWKYRFDKPLPPPGSHIMTKTHCSGYCMDFGTDNCKLKDYATPLADLRKFFETCASGTRYRTLGKVEEITYYNAYSVKKTMLLVRDPLDIIVSRFMNIIEGQPTDQKSFMVNANGIKEWCDSYDSKEGSKNFKNWISDEDTRSMIENGDVTCFAELFRIASFYNQALKVIKFLDHDLHVTHFDDYEEDLGGAVWGMMDFLEYTAASNQRRKSFERYDPNGFPFFEEAQIDNMVSFFAKIASPATQDLFARYIE